MPTCQLCGEENPPSEAICRRCRTSLFVGGAGAVSLPPLKDPRPSEKGAASSPPAPRRVDDVLDFGPLPGDLEARARAAAAPEPTARLDDVPFLDLDPLPDEPEPRARAAPGPARGGAPDQADLPVLAPPAHDQGAEASAGAAVLTGRELLVETPAEAADELLTLDLGSLQGDVHTRAEAREAVATKARRRSVMRPLATPRAPVDPSLVIGAPPLPPFPPLPIVVEVPTKPSSGLFGRIRYGLSAPGVAREGRLVLGALSTSIARAKRHEAVAVSALGRGARKHGLAPDDALDLAEAADHEEQGAQARSDKADQMQAKQQRADEEFKKTRETAEKKLAALEERHAPMAATLADATRRLDGSDALLAELRSREAELRTKAETEPTAEEVGGYIETDGDRIVVKPRSREEEVARRKGEHSAAAAELARIVETVEKLQGQADRLVGPLRVMEEEMERQRAEVRKAQAQLEDAEAQARVADVSKQRRAAFANRSATELDEEIGRLLLAEKEKRPAIAQLLAMVERIQRRVADLEGTQKLQQEELDRFDPDAARAGIRLLVGSVLGLFVLLLGLGEGLRRVLLVLGS